MSSSLDRDLERSHAAPHHNRASCLHARCQRSGRCRSRRRTTPRYRFHEPAAVSRPPPATKRRCVGLVACWSTGAFSHPGVAHETSRLPQGSAGSIAPRRRSHHTAREDLPTVPVAELADERRLMGGDLRRPPLSAELAPGAVAGWLRMITITCRPTLPSRAQRHGRLRRPVCRRLPDRRARIVSRVRTKFGRFPTSTRSNSSGRDRR